MTIVGGSRRPGGLTFWAVPRLAVVLLILFGIAATLPRHATASDLDQSSPATNPGSAQGLSGSAGQTFTAGVSGSLDYVELYFVDAYNLFCTQDDASDPDTSCIVEDGIVREGPGDIVIEIRELDGTGLPTGITLGSGYLGQDWYNDWVGVSLSQPATVTAGTTYALVVSTTLNGGRYALGMSAEGSYAGGHVFNPDGVGGWDAYPGSDMYFQIYVSPVTGPTVVGDGFYAPVTVGLNEVKKGSTVPLKFNVLLDGVADDSTNLSISSLAVSQIDCGTADDLGVVTIPADELTTGGTSLHYDYNTGQFVYNWSTKSDALTKGACYRVEMTATAIQGGAMTTLAADFQLK